MTFFGLKKGQDLENRAAYPRQEFPVVPPPPAFRAGLGSSDQTFDNNR